MGITRFKGPVYGCKSLLWSFGPYAQASTNASTTLLTPNATRTVPPYEDWFITEAALYTSTNSSVAAAHGFYVKVEGGSSGLPPRQNGQGTTNAGTPISLVNAAGSTTWSTWATATISQGELEGFWAPAGSSIRLLTSGATLMGLTQVNVMGYIRYADSTRNF